MSRPVAEKTTQEKLQEFFSGSGLYNYDQFFSENPELVKEDEKSDFRKFVGLLTDGRFKTVLSTADKEFFDRKIGKIEEETEGEAEEVDGEVAKIHQLYRDVLHAYIFQVKSKEDENTFEIRKETLNLVTEVLPEIRYYDYDAINPMTAIVPPEEVAKEREAREKRSKDEGRQPPSRTPEDYYYDLMAERATPFQDWYRGVRGRAVIAELKELKGFSEISQNNENPLNLSEQIKELKKIAPIYQMVREEVDRIWDARQKLFTNDEEYKKHFLPDSNYSDFNKKKTRLMEMCKEMGDAGPLLESRLDKIEEGNEGYTKIETDILRRYAFEATKADIIDGTTARIVENAANDLLSANGEKAFSSGLGENRINYNPLIGDMWGHASEDPKNQERRYLLRERVREESSKVVADYKKDARSAVREDFGGGGLKWAQEASVAVVKQSFLRHRKEKAARTITAEIRNIFRGFASRKLQDDFRGEHLVPGKEEREAGAVARVLLGEDGGGGEKISGQELFGKWSSSDNENVDEKLLLDRFNKAINPSSPVPSDALFDSMYELLVVKQRIDSINSASSLNADADSDQAQAKLDQTRLSKQIEFYEKLKEDMPGLDFVLDKMSSKLTQWYESNKGTGNHQINLNKETDKGYPSLKDQVGHYLHSTENSADVNLQRLVDSANNLEKWIGALGNHQVSELSAGTAVDEELRKKVDDQGKELDQQKRLLKEQKGLLEVQQLKMTEVEKYEDRIKALEDAKEEVEKELRNLTDKMKAFPAVDGGTVDLAALVTKEELEKYKEVFELNLKELDKKFEAEKAKLEAEKAGLEELQRTTKERQQKLEELINGKSDENNALVDELRRQLQKLESQFKQQNASRAPEGEVIHTNTTTNTNTATQAPFQTGYSAHNHNHNHTYQANPSNSSLDLIGESLTALSSSLNNVSTTLASINSPASAGKFDDYASQLLKILSDIQAAIKEKAEVSSAEDLADIKEQLTKLSDLLTNPSQATPQASAEIAFAINEATRQSIASIQGVIASLGGALSSGGVAELTAIKEDIGKLLKSLEEVNGAIELSKVGAKADVENAKDALAKSLTEAKDNLEKELRGLKDAHEKDAEASKKQSEEMRRKMDFGFADMAAANQALMDQLEREKEAKKAFKSPVDINEFRDLARNGLIRDNLLPSMIGGGDKGVIEISEHGMPIFSYDLYDSRLLSSHIAATVANFEATSPISDKTRYTSLTDHKKPALLSIAKVKELSLSGEEITSFCAITVDNNGIGKTFMSQSAYELEFGKPARDFYGKALTELKTSLKDTATKPIDLEALSLKRVLAVALPEDESKRVRDFTEEKISKANLKAAERAVNEDLKDDYQKIISKIKDGEKDTRDNLQDLLNRKQYSALHKSLVNDDGTLKVDLFQTSDLTVVGADLKSLTEKRDGVAADNADLVTLRDQIIGLIRDTDKQAAARAFIDLPSPDYEGFLKYVKEKSKSSPDFFNNPTPGSESGQQLIEKITLKHMGAVKVAAQARDENYPAILKVLEEEHGALDGLIKKKEADLRARADKNFAIEKYHQIVDLMSDTATGAGVPTKVDMLRLINTDTAEFVAKVKEYSTGAKSGEGLFNKAGGTGNSNAEVAQILADSQDDAKKAEYVEKFLAYRNAAPEIKRRDELGAAIQNVAGYNNGTQLPHKDLISRVIKENNLGDKIAAEVARNVSVHHESVMMQDKIEISNFRNKEAAGLSVTERARLEEGDKSLGRILDFKFAPTVGSGTSFLQKSKNQWTVMFNGDPNAEKDSAKGFQNDTAYIPVPGVGGDVFLRATVCTKHNMNEYPPKGSERYYIEVMQGGKKVKEEHVPGDVVMDYNTVFHLVPQVDGKGKPVLNRDGKQKMHYKEINLGGIGTDTADGFVKGVNALETALKFGTLGVSGLVTKKLDRVSEGGLEFGPKKLSEIRQSVNNMEILVGSTGSSGERSFATMNNGRVINHSFGKRTALTYAFGRRPNELMDRIALDKDGNKIEFTFNGKGELEGGVKDVIEGGYHGNSRYVKSNLLIIPDLPDVKIFGKVSVISHTDDGTTGKKETSKIGDVVASDNLFYQDATGKMQPVFKIGDANKVTDHFYNMIGDEAKKINPLRILSEEEVAKMAEKMRGDYKENLSIGAAVKSVGRNINRTIVPDGELGISDKYEIKTGKDNHYNAEVHSWNSMVEVGKSTPAAAVLKADLFQIKMDEILHSTASPVATNGKFTDTNEMKNILKGMQSSKAIEDSNAQGWTYLRGVPPRTEIQVREAKPLNKVSRSLEEGDNKSGLGRLFSSGNRGGRGRT